LIQINGWLTPWMARYAQGAGHEYDGAAIVIVVDDDAGLLKSVARLFKRSPKINFREIFAAVRFSTFATISANSGPWPVAGKQTFR
jgi:hypothetical protein